MSLFNRKSAEARKKDARDRILRSLGEATRDGNLVAIYSCFMNLTAGKHLDAPEAPFVVSGAIESTARRNFDEGLGMAIYALNTMSHPQMTPFLVDKTFSLIDRADRANMKQMASVAMAAGLIVQQVVPHALEHKRAIEAWNAAVDTLAANKAGLQYAFAAVSNAALGDGNLAGPLARIGIDKWEKIVTDLAKSDRKGAFNEVARVATGYTNFGPQAYDFQNRAMTVLDKIARGGKF
ncbi:MAG TPA: hypothetical protein VEF76_06720 [Patescibacteria group bacterium]|nr:hypothetical protein [Patescibacteria group bacterium]